MAVQAVRGHDEREARAHDSIILGHAPAKGSPEEAAQAAAAAKGERGAGFVSELMPSAMRTVQSSQVLKVCGARGRRVLCGCKGGARRRLCERAHAQRPAHDAELGGAKGTWGAGLGRPPS